MHKERLYNPVEVREKAKEAGLVDLIPTKEFNDILEDWILNGKFIAERDGKPFIIPSLLLILKERGRDGKRIRIIVEPDEELFSVDPLRAVRIVGMNAVKCKQVAVAVFAAYSSVLKLENPDNKADKKDEHAPKFEDLSRVLAITGLTFDGRANIALIPMDEKTGKIMTAEKFIDRYSDGSSDEVCPISFNLLWEFYEGMIVAGELLSIMPSLSYKNI